MADRLRVPPLKTSTFGKIVVWPILIPCFAVSYTTADGNGVVRHFSREMARERDSRKRLDVDWYNQLTSLTTNNTECYLVYRKLDTQELHHPSCVCPDLADGLLGGDSCRR
ncbi:hypothetical protein OUZ56_020434 [Daphnia magna]|uniref:Secreted protein n=1 Tax=Daphnia magna TaxID=35525 RepID=A0ABQ9ZF79_9CRUS|nr:hypothetical protein OUZ56_020434 [Daphnia magna]